MRSKTNSLLNTDTQACRLARRYAYMKRPKLRGLWPILAMSAALVSNSFAKTPMPPPDVSPQAPVAALWSDQLIRNAHGVVPVIWVFQEPIQCGQFTWYPQNSLMLTPNRPLADGEYSYSIPAELPICMEFDANLKGVRCRDGEIYLQFFKDAAEYRGTYTLTMDDGSTRNGKFRAQYCPKRR